MSSANEPPRPPRVLLIDVEPAVAALLAEWLGALGCSVETGTGVATPERFDLAIVDVPFPRSGGVDLIRRLAAGHPTTPILALSPCFFGGIECTGALAHALGVACVLPQPGTHEALINAVRRLIPA